MKLDVELIKDAPAYTRLNGSLHCKLIRDDSTSEQYVAMIDYIGFKQALSPEGINQRK